MTEHALSTDEVRANAGKWTLAGDVGLLAHLKQFSEEIIKKAEDTESSLNNLLDKVEETCTNFNNVSNQFLSLQNSQFVENRVYDDETPTEEKERPPQPVEETQQQTLEKYKEAVSIGLNILDSHFEEVVLLESSDSDDETSDSNPALVLRPKTRYTKPLPLTIGSAEWWADDNVGLGEFQENEDSEPELTLSNSEPDVVHQSQVEKRLIRNVSSSSASSIEEVPETKKPNIPAIITIPALDEPPVLPTNDEDDTEDMFKPVDDLFGYVREQSLFGQKKQNMFDSHNDDLFPPVYKPEPKTVESLPKQKEDLFANEDDDPNSVKPKPVINKVSNAFTKELVAKLGSVAKNQNPPEKEVKKEASIAKKVESKPGLFDEFIPPVAKTRTVPTKVEKPPPKPEIRNIKPGLFGEDDEDDDDDLFSGASSRKSNLLPKEKALLFEDDDNDDLFSNVIKKDAVNANKQHGSSTYDSMPKPAAGGSPNLFSGFEDDLDDNNLFAPRTVPQSIPKLAPRIKPSADTSVDNSPGNNMAGVKTSTPALQGTPAVPLDPNPTEDLFGSISRVANESREHSQISNEPSHEDSQIAPNPADVGMMNDTHNESRDLGFIETSSLGDENTSKKDSPANWFHPQLSSTQAVGSSHETSGYKTATVWTGTESAGTDSRSDAKPQEKRFSSILEDSSPASAADKMKSSSKADDLFSGSRKSTNWGAVIDESDDLFSSKPSSSMEPEKIRPQSRHVKIESDLFGQTDTDDLFSTKPKVSENKSDDLPAPKTTSWKPSSIFDDEDDDSSLFNDGKNKLPDNVSVSSSRSSLFDEPSAGKSSLPSIFVNPEKAKVPLFENVDDDFDLFGKTEKKDQGVKKHPETSKSGLFHDDLFGGNVKPQGIQKVETNSSEKIIENPSVEPKLTSSLPVTKKSDSLKDETDGEAKTALPQKPQIVADLFAEDDEILFGSVDQKIIKAAETTKSADPPRPKPPSSLTITKTSDLLKDKPDGETQTTISKKIGKLNIPSGLKINPVALLPGSRPVKVEAPEPAPLDLSSVGCLSSAARDRPRIQVKRRPQTRKARHEALRTSGIDFGVDDGLVGNDVAENFVSPASDKESSSSLFHSVENSPSPAFVSAEVVSPSTDEEDCLSFPDLDVNEREEQNIFKNDADDDLLFGAAPVISPVVNELKKSQENIPKTSDTSILSKPAILSQEIEDEDLFGAPVPSLHGANSLFDDVKVPKKLTEPVATKLITKSLFGDDDDDDIFSGTSVKPAVVSSGKKEITKPVQSNSKVEKVKEPFVDPLGLLHE